MTQIGTSDSCLSPSGGAVALEVDRAPAETLDDNTVSGVRARGHWELAWRRLRRDKLAIAGGVFFISLFFIAFVGAPLASHLLGHGPNEPFFTGGLDSSLLPVGPWSHVTGTAANGTTTHQLFILGADSTLPRDEF